MLVSSTIFVNIFQILAIFFLEMLEKFLHLPPLTRLRAAAHGVQATFIFHQHPPALATYGVAGAADRSGVRGEL
jgi:hypothetical protein